MRLHTFSPRRLTGVAAMAYAAALIPMASLAATAPRASTPGCATSELVVWGGL
jgi:hypothetical protein